MKLLWGQFLYKTFIENLSQSYTILQKYKWCKNSVEQKCALGTLVQLFFFFLIYFFKWAQTTVISLLERKGVELISGQYCGFSCVYVVTMKPWSQTRKWSSTKKQLASNFKSRELDAPRLKTLVNSENKRVASEGLAAGLQSRDVTERL